MIGICNFCNGFFSTTQLSTYPRYSLPKKLLVAVVLVFTIAMVITPTESRHLERRHRHDHMAQTKDFIRTSSRLSLEHKKRHQKRIENLTLPKDMERPKYSRSQKFSREMTKVFRKVKNTKSFSTYERLKNLNLKESMPTWLPTVNFVKIHFHEYTSSKKSGSLIEQKFKYVMPKLYKSLLEYDQLFKLMQNMKLQFVDDGKRSYHTNRSETLKQTINRLYSTIQEVYDSMLKVNVTPPVFKDKDYSMIDTTMDSIGQCRDFDRRTYKGYWNLLSNWESELRCLKKTKQPTRQRVCAEWDRKLRSRKNQKNGDGGTHMTSKISNR